jgi:hypothetical protein
MEYYSYSFNNEQFRSKKVKDKLSKSDFNYYKRLVIRINKFKDTTQQQELENGAPVEKSKIEIDNNGLIHNFNGGEEDQIVNNGNPHSDEPSFTDYLKAEFEEGLFNIQGRVKKMIKQELNSEYYSDNFHKARFDVKLVIKDEEAKYTVFLYRIENLLFEKFDKMPKDTTISFLKMKTVIEDGQIIFKQCEKSEIVFENNPFHDLEKPLVMNHNMRRFYEAERKKSLDKKNLEKSRFPLNGAFRQPVNFEFNGAVEGDPENKLNEYLALSESFPDFYELLTKDVEHSIYGMTNVMRINSTHVKKDVFGMVKSVKVEEKLETVELISLRDSNTIKVLHYNKNINLKLKENMIVSIRGISLKVNKNFDIYLENPDPSSITIYDRLTENEATKFKKFRCNKNMEYGCIIELTKPVLIRTIQKYVITVKKIFKIMAIHEKSSYVISGYPDLKLIAKCLVDDGSFEAQVYIHDHTVVNLFKLDKECLDVRKIFDCF